MKGRQLISSDEAEQATTQHRSPCADCPWARRALPGWTGSLTPQEWLQAAVAEVKIDCHTKLNMQCAGSAIFRANVCKKPRATEIMQLPADREKVFGNPMEFLDHHDS